MEPIDPSVRNTIALCSAGIGLKTSARLEAELAQLRLGGTLSANAQQEIRGALFQEADLSEQGTQKAYENYIACVEGEVGKGEYIEQLENQRSFVIDGLKTTDAPIEEINSIDTLIGEHINAVKTGNQRLAHDLHRQITQKLLALRSEYGANAGELYLPIGQ